MTVGELRRILQYYDNNKEVRFREPTRGKLVELSSHVEDHRVWESIWDKYNGETGKAGHDVVVLVQKDR